MKKILVANPEYFDSEAVNILKGAGRVYAKKLDREQLESLISDADAIVLRVDTKLDRKLLEKAHKLKVIGSATTGLDHIDTKYAGKRGIKIISLHGTHTVSTAEHTIALILSLARKLPWAYENMKMGSWERQKFIGIGLEGKTLGIIGVGRIGSRVALYGKYLGMRVIGYDPYVKPKRIELVKLERVLKESDILTLHPALTDETRNMISRKELKMMKKSALLINTSRGEVVNSKDLLGALDNKTIKGAALDVFPDEPILGKNNIFAVHAKRGNLIITPHLGASTKEAIHMAGIEISKKVKEELKKYQAK